MELEECIICFYDKSIEDYICFGCGHKVCATCYPLMRNICPVCRFKDNDVLNIDVHIVVPSRSNDQPRNNFPIIIASLLCFVLSIIIIYIVIVIPIQSLS